MVYAIDERKQWRAKMEQGEIPERVERSILLYKELREKDDWRSSRLFESLGEAALLWYEAQQKEVKK